MSPCSTAVVALKPAFRSVLAARSTSSSPRFLCSSNSGANREDICGGLETDIGCTTCRTRISVASGRNCDRIILRALSEFRESSTPNRTLIVPLSAAAFMKVRTCHTLCDERDSSSREIGSSRSPAKCKSPCVASGPGQWHPEQKYCHPRRDQRRAATISASHHRVAIPVSQYQRLYLQMS